MAEIFPDRASKGTSSTVAIRKHPLHPAIVGFPVSFLTAALATDLLYWWTVERTWADFSFWLIMAGWITGLASVLTGLIDFLTIARARALATGWIHFILTDLAVFLATFNLFLRLEDRYGFIIFTGLGFSVLVTAFLVAGGFFGGRLIYRYWIGPYGSS